MRSPAYDLKFCGAWARGAIFTHVASRVTFHGCFGSTSTKQYCTKFMRSEGFISRQIPLFMVVTRSCNYSKHMFKWTFLSLIFTPCCKYTHSKNKVKFLQLTSSELLQKLLKLNKVVCCFKLLFYFRIIFAV